jgi:hypothetical protein
MRNKPIPYKIYFCGEKLLNIYLFYTIHSIETNLTTVKFRCVVCSEYKKFYIPFLKCVECSKKYPFVYNLKCYICFKDKYPNLYPCCSYSKCKNEYFKGYGKIECSLCKKTHNPQYKCFKCFGSYISKNDILCKLCNTRYHSKKYSSCYICNTLPCTGCLIHRRDKTDPHCICCDQRLFPNKYPINIDILRLQLNKTLYDKITESDYIRYHI